MHGGESHGSGIRGARAAWLPAWIKSLGAAVWITTSDGNIGYLNERAEALLGLSADDCLGRPCYKVIAGTDASGRASCKPKCPVFGRAQDKREIEPARIRVRGPDGKGRWIEVLHITLSPPESTGVWLVHCALSADRAHRMEKYLARVASRTPHPEISRRTSKRLGLTRRESEILQLLAEDKSLHEIARETHVSYVTVRNHVQHILAKLGVHSIIEAVACHLLVRD